MSPSLSFNNFIIGGFIVMNYIDMMLNTVVQRSPSDQIAAIQYVQNVLNNETKLKNATNVLYVQSSLYCIRTNNLSTDCFALPFL